MTELFPNVRALTAVLPLTGEMAEVAAQDLEAMGAAAGSAGEAFGKMAETTASKLTILETRMQQAKDAIAGGATPAMLGLRTVVVELAEGLAWLNEKTSGMVGAIWTVGSAIATLIGSVVTVVAQYTLMAAAHLQIKIAAEREAVAQAKLAAARLGTAGAGDMATKANMKLTSSQVMSTAAMQGGAGAAYKWSGGLMKLSSLAPQIMGVASAVAAVALAVGALMKYAQKQKAAQLEMRQELGTFLDVLDDGTEDFRRHREAVMDNALTNANTTAMLQQQTLAMIRNRDAWEKGSEAAMIQKQAWIEAEIEQRELASVFRDNVELYKEIKAEADKLYGSEMALQGAVAYLYNEVGLSLEVSKELAKETKYLTKVELDRTVALYEMEQASEAARLEMEKKIRAMEREQELADEFVSNTMPSLTMSLEEVDSKLEELGERYDMARIMQRKYVDDTAVTNAFNDEAFAIHQEIIALEALRDTILEVSPVATEYSSEIEEVQTIHYGFVESTEEVVEALTDVKDEMEDVAREAYALKVELENNLFKTDYEMPLEEQLIRLRQRLGRAISSWGDLWGESEDRVEGFEEVFVRMMDGMDKQLKTGFFNNAQEAMEYWIKGIEDSGFKVSEEIYNFIREYIMAYMQLNSPAKKGPMATLDHWADDYAETWNVGFKRGFEKDRGRAATDVSKGMTPGNTSQAGPSRPSIVIQKMELNNYDAKDALKMKRAVVEALEEVMIS